MKYLNSTSICTKNLFSRHLRTTQLIGLLPGFGPAALFAQSNLQSSGDFISVPGIDPPEYANQPLTLPAVDALVVIPPSQYKIVDEVVYIHVLDWTRVSAAGGIADISDQHEDEDDDQVLFWLPSFIGAASLSVLLPTKDTEDDASIENEMQGYITDEQVFLDLGQSFTIHGGNQAYYAPKTYFRVFGSVGDDTVGQQSAPEDNIADGDTVIVDLTEGGNNTVLLGNHVAANKGVIELSGGKHNDAFLVGDFMAENLGHAAIDLSEGGDNVLTFGRETAIDNGALQVIGGPNDETIAFGESAAASSGVITLDMSNGGNNRLNFSNNAATDGGEIDIVGGSGNDDVTFNSSKATDSKINVDFSNGGDNSLTFEYVGGVVNVVGGSGTDILTFTDQADLRASNIDLSVHDRKQDIITFDTHAQNVVVTGFEDDVDQILLNNISVSDIKFTTMSDGGVRVETGPWTMDQIDLVIHGFDSVTSANLRNTADGYWAIS